MSPLAVSLRFLQTQPDARLVELARNGHERAFEALVRRYRGPLLAYCRRVSPRGTAAEDILQQGLLQAWRAISGGAEVRDARAWMYRIVHNVAISAARSSGEPTAGIVTLQGSPGADQVVEQRMAVRDALAGLAALPDLQRQVMMSTALDGQSHEQIAEALGVTSGSVRGLLYRARATLRAAAAAVIPAPAINWAIGETGGASASLAGVGSAGIGALVLKGGAILAVGAVAGTTAIVIEHHSQHGRPAEASATAATVENASELASTSAPGARDRAGAVLATVAPSGANGTRSGGRGSGFGRIGGPGRSNGFRDGGSHRGNGPGGTSKRADGSPSGNVGSSSGGSGSRGGSDGGGAAVSTSGPSRSGGDQGGGSTATTGSGGGDHNATTTSSVSDGRNGSGSGGTNGTSSSGGSTDGGSSGGSGGGSSGGSDGGMLATGTATNTVDH